eukprot:jgi/Bigna1/139546/aug1.51_g14254
MVSSVMRRQHRAWVIRQAKYNVSSEAQPRTPAPATFFKARTISNLGVGALVAPSKVSDPADLGRERWKGRNDFLLRDTMEEGYVWNDAGIRVPLFPKAKEEVFFPPVRMALWPPRESGAAEAASNGKVAKSTVGTMRWTAAIVGRCETLDPHAQNRILDFVTGENPEKSARRGPRFLEYDRAKRMVESQISDIEPDQIKWVSDIELLGRLSDQERYIVRNMEMENYTSCYTVEGTFEEIDEVQDINVSSAYVGAYSVIVEEGGEDALARSQKQQQQQQQQQQEEESELKGKANDKASPDFKITKWAEGHQKLLACGNMERKMELLGRLKEEIEAIAVPIAREIIDENHREWRLLLESTNQSVAKESKETKVGKIEKKPKKYLPADVGGVAGGTKFICEGFLFKLATDPVVGKNIHLYGGGAKPSLDRAAKAAAHELHGEYFAFSNEGLSPFMSRPGSSP